MSNRPVFLLWLSISIKDKKSFRLIIPLPFFLLLMLADMAEDIADFISIFPAGKRAINKRISAKNGHEMIFSARTGISLIKGIILELIFNTEPVDIIDVDVADGDKRVKVKCSIK